MLRLIHIQTPDAYTKARELVRSVYVREGYTQEETPIEQSMHAYIGRPLVDTFCAYVDDVLLGTISLAHGSLQDVPMEAVYPEEIDTFRKQGTRFGEVCQFAVDVEKVAEATEASRGGFAEFDVAVQLLGTAVRRALAHDIEKLCFVVNPKHASFYESLGCEQIGDVRAYESVSGAPACAYILPLTNRELGTHHFLAKKIWSIARDLE